MKEESPRAAHVPGEQIDHRGDRETEATIAYRYELIRKAIHLGSLSIPIIYSFISKQEALRLLIPVTAWFLLVDIGRYYFPPVADLFYRTFGWLLRKKELDAQTKRLNGATNILLSACLCVALFPRIITITAFSILIISDSTSALVGRKYGRRKFFNKSLEGSLAFLISAMLVVLVTPKIQSHPLEFAAGFIGAVVGTLFEALPVGIDDNISVPVSVGAVMWGFYAVFLPSFNLS